MVILYYLVICRGILVTNGCLMKGEGMTRMQRRSRSGSQRVPPVSLRQLNSLDLMTKSLRMINAGPSGQGSGQSP